MQYKISYRWLLYNPFELKRKKQIQQLVNRQAALSFDIRSTCPGSLERIEKSLFSPYQRGALLLFYPDISLTPRSNFLDNIVSFQDNSSLYSQCAPCLSLH